MSIIIDLTICNNIQLRERVVTWCIYMYCAYSCNLICNSEHFNRVHDYCACLWLPTSQRLWWGSVHHYGCIDFHSPKSPAFIKWGHYDYNTLLHTSKCAFTIQQCIVLKEWANYSIVVHLSGSLSLFQVCFSKFKIASIQLQTEVRMRYGNWTASCSIVVG